MKKKFFAIFFVFSTALVCTLLIFFIGYFRFGSHGNWNGLVRYQFDGEYTGFEIQRCIFSNAEKRTDSIQNLAGTGFKNWYSIITKIDNDTVAYIFRMNGDSTEWASRDFELDLMSIESKGLRLKCSDKSVDSLSWLIGYESEFVCRFLKNCKPKSVEFCEGSLSFLKESPASVTLQKKWK